MSVAFITIKPGENMLCKGAGWSTTVGALHSLVIEATCANCYHAGWRCPHGVR